MLNALDGINGNDGSSKYRNMKKDVSISRPTVDFLFCFTLVVFMTCNDMNKITPALLRPGRMDVKLELGYAVHEQIEAMFWRFFATLDFDDSDDEDDKINMEEDEQLQQEQHNTSNLPPTPVSEPEDEEGEGHTEDQDKERMAYLNDTLQKLLALIPEHHVTTAEMQSLFVTLFLEAGPNKIDEKELLERLLKQVPDFMDRIKLDREQAKLHDKLANKDDDKADSDKDSEAENDDTKEADSDDKANSDKDSDAGNDDKKGDDSEKTDSASS